MMPSLRRFLPRGLRREISAWVRERSLEVASERVAPAEARLTQLERQMNEARSDLTALDTTLQQVLTLLRREAGIAGPPPRHLQERVVGKHVPGFLESGYELCRELDEALAPAGRKLADF